MRSESSSGALGSRLRETARTPEDPSAAQLRARLRQRMFGVGEAPPDVPEQRVAGGGLGRALAWVIPAVAVVAVVAVAVWTRPTHAPPPVQTLSAAIRIEPALETPEPSASRAGEGPRLLEDARARGDDAGIELAVRGAWADPASPARCRATLALAGRLRRGGEPRRALRLLRAVLDELELARASGVQRAALVREIAEAYAQLGHTMAADAAREEARRLAPH